MRLRNVLVTGMNIPDETYRLLKKFECTTGMTESERKAYEMGIKNFRSILKTLLESDDHVVIHLEGHNQIEELDLDELLEIIEEKERFC